MPNKDGHEVLCEMKADASLRTIPVIMFTTSCYEEDISRSYANGANTFIPKPVAVNALEHLLANVADYWGKIAQLPARLREAG
jgi:CheY-like chemotaxis protein